MYMCVQKLCVWCATILVPRRREWQDVLAREKYAGSERVELSWQCNGHVDEHTIDLTLMMQKNLRSSKERAIRSVFHLTR